MLILFLHYSFQAIKSPHLPPFSHKPSKDSPDPVGPLLANRARPLLGGGRVSFPPLPERPFTVSPSRGGGIFPPLSGNISGRFPTLPLTFFPRKRSERTAWPGSASSSAGKALGPSQRPGPQGCSAAPCGGPVSAGRGAPHPTPGTRLSRVPAAPGGGEGPAASGGAAEPGSALSASALVGLISTSKPGLSPSLRKGNWGGRACPTEGTGREASSLIPLWAATVMEARGRPHTCPRDWPGLKGRRGYN